jgi:glycosyltransferase involved in cell wall biosynthesis
VKVALASVYLGRVQRGFERYFGDLFGVLQGEIDITLFQGGPPAQARERKPPLQGPLTAAASLLPLGRSAAAEYKDYKRDCVAFGLGLLPDLLRNRFDVLHCIDPPLAVVLQRLQSASRFRPRLLFTEGCLMPPSLYPRVAHIHHVARAAFEEGLAAGVPEAHMTLVPCGLHTGRFAPPAAREALRRKHGVGPDTFVVLAVSAVKRLHKRVDHIVREARELTGDVQLWIDGNPEDAVFVDEIRRELGPRARITHVPSADVPELYALADVMVHAALGESFGLAIVEALSSGLLVLAHDSPHFEWLVGDRACLVDMASPGKLAARLRELQVAPAAAGAGAAARAARVRERFDWSSLVPAYVDMYRKVATLEARPVHR